jgi:hypothetical protein
MSWLWFSCLALLFLLPPVSFAQSHLWQYRPFRANDTDHSGGDHICDLRRDGNADGKPDMLGQFVSVRGTVVVEPSTFEFGGCLFWIRDGACGILVCGEPESLSLGDSVSVRGLIGFGGGDLVFSEMMPADLSDVILSKAGTATRYGTGDNSSVPVSPEEFVGRPSCYGGNIVTLTKPVEVIRTSRTGRSVIAWVSSGCDSLIVYANDDSSCPILPGRFYIITGVVMGITMCSGSATSAGWCVAPRGSVDVTEVGSSPACRTLSWGHLKTEYGR